ncbi:MAG TPA: tryptophan--tRNA ligase [Leptospiraceae bacterium]|nr:tryptophan--tRNA ligase [Leptospiraceae bacterium]HMW04538.1 tryptophan--tRNA ligase [Leptospiraceae bacterium]HMX34335.1 tryptophan--tRNA ligase [Leptospiraceae bacterium]HMY30724.1 tryptophan--tRNA ligase [Leptospiraceae bacterium]HMZ64302.1 tryptophan--tRNA ligase [Leptospiraceae bacterium]
MRILTGVQPSGKLHLGNYFAVMDKMIRYQENNDLFCFIANLHSLTSFKSKEALVENTFEAACDFFALGIDPDKSTFWVQSDVPLVTELTWYLSMCINVNQLHLAHSYKDKTAKGINPTGGLFFYPILMAADILLFDSQKVPVGKDQKQHLEFTRDIANKFNHDFGTTFLIPEPEIDEGTAIIPGTDGQKMSKSYGNTINFFDKESSLRKSVMSIVSDSAGIEEAKDPDKSVIFAIFKLFLNETDLKTLRTRFETPGLRYGDIKKELFSTIMDYFAPYRKKREELVANRDYVQSLLLKGAEKANKVAIPVIERVRERLGIKRI